MISIQEYSGREPGIGSFDCRVDPTGDDWCIFITMLDGRRIERWCSTSRGKPAHGLLRVYQILRDYGFTIAGVSK